jgi:hypothetical protein
MHVLQYAYAFVCPVRVSLFISFSLNILSLSLVGLKGTTLKYKDRFSFFYVVSCIIYPGGRVIQSARMDNAVPHDQIEEHEMAGTCSTNERRGTRIG